MIAIALEPSGAEAAIRRMQTFVALDEDDRRLVHSHVGRPVEHRPGADLGDDGDGSCRFLVSGWACRARMTPFGDRQIFDFALPGDSIGFSMRPRPDGLYRVVALGRGATVDASGLRDLLRREPHLRPGLRQASLEAEHAETGRLLDHAVRLGACTAYEAAADLFLDLHGRLSAVGLAQGPRFPMPLSQEILREALGISAMQINRVLSQLRREQLIALGPGWAEILDRDALAAVAGKTIPAEAKAVS